MTRTVIFGLVAVMLACAPVRADEPAAKAAQADIDLAICLDVSGSMSGLINAARSKLWETVNELARAKPAPNLRVALYSYGASNYDAKTGWVRQEVGLTPDLDKVSDKLFGLRTGGGTELVARVTKAALEQLSWSSHPKALKIIFVAGNESADQDKQYSLKEVAEKAVRQGVIVNTIYCGSDVGAVAAGWRDFALLAEGRYGAIDHNKSVVTVATPHDKAIADLGAKLNDTYLFAGKDRKELRDNQQKQDVNAAQAGAGVALERTVTKANGIYRFAQDLVERVQKKEQVDLSKIPAAELPEALRKLPPAEQDKHLKELAAKRTALQTQILELNRQRETYLRDNQKKAPQGGFDGALRGALREQAIRKGIDLGK